MARLGQARRGLVTQVTRGTVWTGIAGSGRHGKAGTGAARLESGKAGLECPGLAGLGLVR